MNRRLPTLIAVMFSPLALATGTTAAGKQAPIAYVGKATIALAQLEQRNQSRLDELDATYQRSLEQIDERRARERHEVLEQSLEKWLDDRALELEGAARSKSRNDLMSEVRVSVVTDEDARAYYAEFKAASDPPVEQVLPQVKQYLSNERNEAATRDYLDGLRQKHGIRSTLEPYRLAVSANGPSRGAPAARVTIVEFGDFQCPYCAQAQKILASVLRNHPDDVRVVFRNFPLEQIHANAQVSATAGVCATRQGKFWEMHDAMYAHQDSLAMGGLLEFVRQLGLDSSSFKDCMVDPAVAALIESDYKDGLKLGVDGTPAFFINGRPLSGNQPASAFDALIRDELSRGRSSR